MIASNNETPHSKFLFPEERCKTAISPLPPPPPQPPALSTTTEHDLVGAQSGDDDDDDDDDDRQKDKENLRTAEVRQGLCEAVSGTRRGKNIECCHSLHSFLPLSLSLSCLLPPSSLSARPPVKGRLTRHQHACQKGTKLLRGLGC